MIRQVLKKTSRFTMIGCVGLLVSACSSLPANRAEPTSFDLGVFAASAVTQANACQFSDQPVVAIPEILMSGAINSLDIVYRFSDVQSNEPKGYTQSRWVQHPREMLRTRAQQYLGMYFPTVLSSEVINAQTWILRLSLEDFSQHFKAEDRSEGVMRLRATLVRSGRLIGQKVFEVTVPAQTTNASGAAKALSIATDQTLGKVTQWMCGLMQE